MTFIKEPAKVGNILSAFWRNNTPAAVANWFSILSMWPKIAGINIAKKTRPLKIAGKTLYLTVETSTWMEELKYIKEDIIKKINEELKDIAVKDIVFRLGKVTHVQKTPASTRRSSSHAHCQLSQKEMDRIDKLVIPIKDEELQESIRRAILANKSRGTHN